jgi:PAS domain S-box-containing protein
VPLHDDSEFTPASAPRRGRGTPVTPPGGYSHRSLLASLAESTADGILAFDYNLNVTFFNSAYQRILRLFTDAPLRLGHCHLDHLPEPMAEMLRERYRRTFTGESFTIQADFETAEGHRWFESSYSPVIEQDRVIGGCLFVRDITERKQADIRLIENEIRLRGILRDSPYYILTTDNEGRFTYANRLPEGYETDQVLGSCIFDYPHPGDAATVRDVFEKAEQEERAQKFDWRVTAPGGDLRWFASVVSPLRRNGANTGFLVFSEDVTERRVNETWLRLYQTATARTEDVIIVTEAEPLDPPGPRILYVNQAFEQMTGYAAEEVIGETPRILQGPKTDWETLKRVKTAMRDWRPIRVELINYRKDGAEVWVDLSLAPVSDGQGRFAYWLGIQRDITPQKRLEQTLRAMVEEKEVLIQEIHHRVKNNLQTVVSLLDLHAANETAPGFRTAVREARNRVEAMSLIHEQLYRQPDVSRVDLGQFVQTLADHLQTSFGTARATLVTRCAPVALPLATAVPLGLMLNEMLSNAFKHGVPLPGPGAIEVMVATENGRLNVTVRDHGPRKADIDGMLASSRTLGLRLIRLLAGQLGATLTLAAADPGLRAEISLPLPVDSAQGEHLR